MRITFDLDSNSDQDALDAIECIRSLFPNINETIFEPVAIVPTKQVFIADDNTVTPIATEPEAIAAMQALVARHGAEGVAKALDVLKSFGAARVTELKPEQRAAFIEKAKVA